MWQQIRDAWASASDPVRIVLIVAVAAVLIAATYFGFDVSGLL